MSGFTPLTERLSGLGAVVTPAIMCVPDDDVALGRRHWDRAAFEDSKRVLWPDHGLHRRTRGGRPQIRWGCPAGHVRPAQRRGRHGNPPHPLGALLVARDVPL